MKVVLIFAGQARVGGGHRSRIETKKMSCTLSSLPKPFRSFGVFLFTLAGAQQSVTRAMHTCK